MELILFYDTETNGLPQWSLPSEDPSQPHITQLAAQLCDERSGNTVAAMNVLIAPDGWDVPADLAELTGITTERAISEGVLLAAAFDQFLDMWGRATMRVGHNESFDARMVRIELFRLFDGDHEIHDRWKGAPAFCTQGRCTKIINLPPTPKMLAAGRKHAKSPNLSEAYEFFTGTKLEGAHDAMVDVAAAKEVYYGIKRVTAGKAA